MIGLIVQPLEKAPPQTQGTHLQPSPVGSEPADPLSNVLALIKPQVYVAGGFAVRSDIAIHFPRHAGIKCYAMLAGQCWLVVEGVPEPVALHAGDCFLLPRGLPFQLTTDLVLEPVHYSVARARLGMSSEAPGEMEGLPYIAGGHFSLTGGAAEMILQCLPPIVHIQRESDKAAMRWSIERMRAELSAREPGSSLMAQQLAYTMLLQALRLHVSEVGRAGTGWLAALSDKHIGLAISSMHGDPGCDWTLQLLADRVGMSRSVFAFRFREIVGRTPMEYLTRWRMLLAADRLKTSSDGLSTIAQSVGYQSESAFGKAFRRIMGCSPRQYTRPGLQPDTESN